MVECIEKISDGKVSDEQAKKNMDAFTSEREIKMALVNGFISALNSDLISAEVKADILDSFSTHQDSCQFDIRECSECHKYFVEGVCIEGGEDYYCSSECMLKNMTQAEFDELYDDNNGESYWTDWVYF